MSTSHDKQFLINMKQEFIEEGSNLVLYKGYREYHDDCLEAAAALSKVISIYEKMVQKNVRPEQVNVQ